MTGGSYGTLRKDTPSQKKLCSFSAQSRKVEFSTRWYFTPQRYPKPKNNVPSQRQVERLSSVQDGICALEKAHMRSTSSLRRLPNVAFETAPLLVCLTDDGPFSSFQGGSSSALSFLDPPASLAEAASSIIFVATKVFRRDKNMLVATKLCLSRQNIFVATSTLLSRQTCA